MIDKLSLLLVLAALPVSATLTSCQRVEPVTEMEERVEPPEISAELTFSVVAAGSQSPVEPGEYVYRDANEWRAVQQGMRGVDYEPSLSMEGVLLAAVDAPAGGYRVRFDSVYAEPTRDVRAIYTVEMPGADCVVTQALTQPFQAVAVHALPEGNVRFIQRRQTYGC